MFKTFFIGATLCALSIPAYAQETLVGKWSGSYLYVGNLGGTTAPANIGVELEITSVEGNVVKGLAKQFSRICGGEYPLSGKLDGNNLGMVSAPNMGPTGDCRFGFRAVVDGSKMTGKVGNYDLQLSKK
jgi:hypothetical protein